ncbi:MAG: hypothetical protein JAY90_19960 [Candidatus Thiodiazotropha lotti]|nr:hypothetical protein [Candidatus Thiodiazotropha lotti]
MDKTDLVREGILSAITIGRLFTAVRRTPFHTISKNDSREFVGQRFGPIDMTVSRDESIGSHLFEPFEAWCCLKDERVVFSMRLSVLFQATSAVEIAPCTDLYGGELSAVAESW